MSCRHFLAIAIAALLVSGAAEAGPIDLDSREYKLMLGPEHFAGGDSQAVVDRLDEALKPLIAAQVSNDAERDFSKREFKLDKRRTVRFWDTATCGLDGAGFALRERADLDDQDRASDDRELTLKFRTVDLFLAAQTPLPAMEGAKDPESKLEEDVAPLAVRRSDGSGVVGDPPSTRSLYSRSTKQQVKAAELPDTLAEAAVFYPTLAESLEASGVDVEMSEELAASDEFMERVYESPKFSLGDGMKTRISLTLWYDRAGDSGQPALAEVSFKYDTNNGDVPRKVAQRALDLYRAMLGLAWAKPDAPTKTAIVTPSVCSD